MSDEKVKLCQSEREQIVTAIVEAARKAAIASAQAAVIQQGFGANSVFETSKQAALDVVEACLSAMVELNCRCTDA